LVPEAHDLSLGRPRAYLEHVGERRALDQERVVARRDERVRELREDRATVVQDGGGLAVHEPFGSDHATPEGLTNRLMAEADPEDGYRSRKAHHGTKTHASLIRSAQIGRASCRE